MSQQDNYERVMVCVRAFLDAHPGWSLDPRNAVRSPGDDKIWFTDSGVGAFAEWARQHGYITAPTVPRLITGCKQLTNAIHNQAQWKDRDS